MIPQEIVDAFWRYARTLDYDLGLTPEDFEPHLEMFAAGWKACEEKKVEQESRK